MKLHHDMSVVHTTHPFVIARGGASEHRLIRVRITDDDGVEGWGEAAPNRFYGLFDKEPDALTRSQAGQDVDYIADGRLTLQMVEVQLRDWGQ